MGLKDPITRDTPSNYETRRALYQSYQMNELLDRPERYISDVAKRRVKSSVDRVLRYLLFCDEFKLTDSVTGSTTFTDDFQRRGKRDSEGRSLRDFDLRTRLFKYPCSYLIHSKAFGGMPDEVRTRVLKRLDDILEGRDPSPEFAHLSHDVRGEISGILIETHSEFKRLRGKTE